MKLSTFRQYVHRYLVRKLYFLVLEHVGPEYLDDMAEASVNEG